MTLGILPAEEAIFTEHRPILIDRILDASGALLGEDRIVIIQNRCSRDTEMPEARECDAEAAAHVAGNGSIAEEIKQYVRHHCVRRELRGTARQCRTAEHVVVNVTLAAGVLEFETQGPGFIRAPVCIQTSGARLSVDVMVNTTKARSVDFGNVIAGRFEVTSCDVSSRGVLRLPGMIWRQIINFDHRKRFVRC